MISRFLIRPKRRFVGVAGFEPATSCSQSRRDNRATLHPEWCIFTGMNPAKQYVKNLFDLHASGVTR